MVKAAEKIVTGLVSSPAKRARHRSENFGRFSQLSTFATTNGSAARRLQPVLTEEEPRLTLGIYVEPPEELITVEEPLRLPGVENETDTGIGEAEVLREGEIRAKKLPQLLVGGALAGNIEDSPMLVDVDPAFVTEDSSQAIFIAREGLSSDALTQELPGDLSLTPETPEEPTLAEPQIGAADSVTPRTTRITDELGGDKKISQGGGGTVTTPPTLPPEPPNQPPTQSPPTDTTTTQFGSPLPSEPDTTLATQTFERQSSKINPLIWMGAIFGGSLLATIFSVIQAKKSDNKIYGAAGTAGAAVAIGSGAASLVTWLTTPSDPVSSLRPYSSDESSSGEASQKIISNHSDSEDRSSWM